MESDRSFDLGLLDDSFLGTQIPELCREYGMSTAIFYKWRAKYGGINTSMMARLKKMYVEERLKAEIAREAIEKSADAI